MPALNADNRIAQHYHVSEQILDASTGDPPIGESGDYITQDNLDDALAALDFPPDVVNNFVTNVAVNETFVTELTTNETFISETVNQLTTVEENNSYITQITNNETFVTQNITQITNVINNKKGLPSELATLAADSQLTHSQIPGELLVGSLEFIIDGAGSAITTGIKGDIQIPFAHTLTAWRLLADQSGSIVIDVWRDSYANFPPVVGDSVSTSKPTLSSASKAEDTTITDWTEAGNAGDIYRFNVDSATTVTRVTLILEFTRTIA